MKTWFNITQAATKDAPTEIEIYDEIGFWGATAKDFARQVKAIKGDLLLRINSPGGSVFEAVAIYNMLRARKGRVDTVVDGMAASAASIIMLAGETRSMGTGSFVMVHRASSIVAGNADDIRKSADDLAKIEGGIRAIYADRTGADEAAIDAWFDGENHWMDSADATEAGFATETFEQLQAVARFEDVAKFNDAPAALKLAAPQMNTIIKEEPMKGITATLDLGENTTEAAVIEAVNNIKAEAQAAHDHAKQLESKLTEAENTIAQYRQNEAEAVVNAAIESGKIDASGKDTLTALAINDLAQVKAIIASVKSAYVAPSAPIVPAEAESQSGPSIRDQFNSITNAAERAKFYARHKDQLFN